METLETIDEQIGYLLLPDNSQQRIFLWIGPPRSGKGTMQILSRADRPRNIAATSPAALGGDFGLANLLGKTVAFMGDAAHRATPTTALSCSTGSTASRAATRSR